MHINSADSFMEKKIAQAAIMLRQAQKHAMACQPVREFIGAENIEYAYKIQNTNTNYRLEAGEVIVGKKIGLTSVAVQKQLGVNQPDFGVLFENMRILSTGILPFSGLIQPKAEAEIAFVLKKDLTNEISFESIVKAIDYAVCAIEIVDSRVDNWDIRITDTIADNASSSHFILGTKKVDLNKLDLEACEMKLYKNDQLVSEGNGKACLGNPLNALLWLANKMKEVGMPLKKKEIILSGALGPMTTFEKGDMIKTTIDGLGEVAFYAA